MSARVADFLSVKIPRNTCSWSSNKGQHLGRLMNLSNIQKKV